MELSPSADNPVVLLIEDDADIRFSMTECLEGEGFTVIGAQSVDEGFEQLRRGTSRWVILLDLMMPIRTGWDFRREQLADPELCDIPVVVVTASGIGEEAIRQDMGDVDLIAKPFTTASLLEAITRALARSQPR